MFCFYLTFKLYFDSSLLILISLVWFLFMLNLCILLVNIYVLQITLSPLQFQVNKQRGQSLLNQLNRPVTGFQHSASRRHPPYPFPYLLCKPLNHTQRGCDQLSRSAVWTLPALRSLDFGPMTLYYTRYIDLGSWRTTGSWFIVVILNWPSVAAFCSAEEVDSIFNYLFGS